MLRSSGAQQVIQLLAIRRNRWKKTISFRGDLPIASRVMKPHRALAGANGGDKGAAVGIDFDSLFLRDAGGNLFGCPIGETLPPDVKSVACVGGEIHPLPIRGPGGIRTATRRRADRFSRRAAVEWRESAGQPR